MKRILKKVALVLGGLFVLLGIAVAITLAVVDIDKIVNQKIATYKPQLEEKTGRKLDLGKVSTHLFPTTGATIADVSVGPDPDHPEDDLPLLRAHRLTVDVSLWKALFSLGKNLSIHAIELDGVKVSLVRYKDGTLSYEPLINRLSPPAPDDQKDEKSGLSPETLKLIQGASIASIRLTNWEIRLADDAPGDARIENSIKKLNLLMNDVALEKPVKVHLDAAMFAESTNFKLDLTAGPFPKDLDFETHGLPPVGDIQLDAQKVDLAKIAPYLAPNLPHLDSATLSSKFAVGNVTSGKPFDVQGNIDVAQVVFTGGVPFDLHLDTRSSVDPKPMSVDVGTTHLNIGAIMIEAQGKLLNLKNAPEFKSFEVKSSSLAPGLLLSYYPDAKKKLPPGSVLDGVGSLALTASGQANKQTVAGTIDLTPVKLLLPGMFNKPSGVALQIKLDGDLTSSDVLLRQLALQLDEMNLNIAGTVKSFSHPAFDLTMKAPPFRFDRIVRFSPSVAQSLASSKTSAAGTGSIDGHIKGTTEALDAQASIALNQTSLDTPAAAMKGDFKLDAVLKGDLSKSYSAKADFNGDSALLRVPGKIDKAPGTPFSFKADVTRSGSNLAINAFRLALANLDLTATGGFDLGKGSTAVKIQMARVDLGQLAKTVIALPADRVKGGFFEGNIALSGNPNKLDTMALSVTPFKVQFGSSSATGNLSVANLTKPTVKMDVQSPRLDLDQLMPASSGSAGGGAAQGDDPSLKKYTVDGNLAVGTLILKGVTMTDAKAKFSLANGLLRFDTLTFNAFGGSVAASGTELEIWRGKMPYKAQLAVKSIDANQALSKLTRYGGVVSGHSDLNLTATGQGFELKDLERALQGQAKVAFLDGSFQRGNVTRSVLGNVSALSSLPGNPLSKLGADTKLKNLQAMLKIQDGKMMLQQPITLGLDGGRTELSGGLGVAGGLALKGTFFIAPQSLAQLTGGVCKATSEIPIPLNIGGDLLSPKFTPDAAALTKSLVPLCIGGQLGGLAQKVLGTDPNKAIEKGKAEAQKAVDKAKADVQAAADKAKADAQKAAQDAIDKAKSSAADKLKGLFKR